MNETTESDRRWAIDARKAKEQSDGYDESRQTLKYALDRIHECSEMGFRKVKGLQLHKDTIHDLRRRGFEVELEMAKSTYYISWEHIPDEEK